MNAYQQTVLRTAAPRDEHDELFHLLLGLVGETGEIAEKTVRDKGSDFSHRDIEARKKELGDILWYLAVLADRFDIEQEVVELNIAKLTDRRQRAALNGSGDNR